MADITQIRLRLVTASVFGRSAGSEGDIFLGLAGREFYVRHDRDDLGREGAHTYVFGEGATVVDAEFNDPRNPQLATVNVYRFPTYIRFEPSTRDDNWLLRLAEVTVRSPEAEEISISVGPVGSGPFWLGHRRGKVVHLWPPDPLAEAEARPEPSEG